MDGNSGFYDSDAFDIRERLAQLEHDHRTLDQQIRDLHAKGADALSLQRLKRQKLMMRDQMVLLQDQLRPDIIA